MTRSLVTRVRAAIEPHLTWYSWDQIPATFICGSKLDMHQYPYLHPYTQHVTSHLHMRVTSGLLTVRTRVWRQLHLNCNVNEPTKHLRKKSEMTVQICSVYVQWQVSVQSLKHFCTAFNLNHSWTTKPLTATNFPSPPTHTTSLTHLKTQQSTPAAEAEEG